MKKVNMQNVFYENKGYFVYGITETLKYRELKMRKEI